MDTNTDGMSLGEKLEHQTPRDIRQWAICEAGRFHGTDPDKVLKTAKLYADYVEGASLSHGMPHAPGTSPRCFLLVADDIDGRRLYLVDPAYSEHGNLSPSTEVARVFDSEGGARAVLADNPIVDGRELRLLEIDR